VLIGLNEKDYLRKKKVELDLETLKKLRIKKEKSIKTIIITKRKI